MGRMITIGTTTLAMANARLKLPRSQRGRQTAAALTSPMHFEKMLASIGRMGPLWPPMEPSR